MAICGMAAARVMWLMSVLALAQSDVRHTRDVHELDPRMRGPQLVDAARQAQQRGFAYLLATQNGDGSWGSHDPLIPNLKDFGFQLKNRGSQDGVRLACTSICAQALLHKPDRSTEEDAALSRALDAVLGQDHMAYHRGEAFNTWGYGYKLEFLVDCLEAKYAPQRREAMMSTALSCVRGLKRFQQADGGWNYYAGPMMGGQSMSFNTAVFARAMGRARKLGVEVPEALVDDAVRLMRRMRTIRGGFVYDARFLHAPRTVNELSSASRTAVCALALYDLGAYHKADLLQALEVFNEGENYLEDGRKLITPHTAVHQISGYFFFFGYNYMAELAERLENEVDVGRWERLAWTMVRTQESDGSWWDTPAADYGDKWGTGFALQVLQRYIDHVD